MPKTDMHTVESMRASRVSGSVVVRLRNVCDHLDQYLKGRSDLPDDNNGIEAGLGTVADWDSGKGYEGLSQR